MRFGPTLTPMRTASTGGGPGGAATGTRISVAGRLLTRLASTALTPPTSSSAGSESPAGRIASTASASPLSLAAAHDHAEAEHEDEEHGSAARTSPAGAASPRTSAGAVIAAAPAAATHTGATRAPSWPRSPASVSAEDREREARQRRALGRRRRRPPRPPEVGGEEAREHDPLHRERRRAVGSAMSPAKRVNDRPLAWKARRLVRLETGSSSDAEFARCEQA